MENKITPNAWLRAELAKRQSANSRYSLRSFAKTIGVAPGRVSEWLADKREISLRSIQEITKILGYSPSEATAVIGSIYQNKIKTEILGSTDIHNPYLLLNDQFHLVKEPYHYALMELIHTRGFREDYSWIGKRLNVSEVQARGGVERLLRVGLLERDGKKNLIHAHRGSTTTTDIPSEALRESHRKTLEDAMDALENIPIEERDITSITVAIDTSKLPMAKQMIRDFRKQLASFLSSGSKDEVYNLNVQLVPASFYNNKKTETNKKEKKARNVK